MLRSNLSHKGLLGNLELQQKLYILSLVGIVALIT